MLAKRSGKFLIFASHGVLMYVVFVIVPIILCLIYSFTNLNPLFPNWNFIGFENYAALAKDAEFWHSVRNTVFFAVIVTAATNALGVAIAMLLNYRGRFYYFLRSMFFAPQVMSAIVVGFIWSIILTDNGIL